MRSASVIAVVLVLLSSSCGRLNEIPTAPGSGSGEPIDPTATFSRVQNEIFTPTCASIACHDTIGQQQQLVLTPGRSYAQITGKPSTELPGLMRIAPGDPANSYMYRKITGSGITGDRMPQGGPYLTEPEAKLVRDWIRRGAPND